MLTIKLSWAILSRVHLRIPLGVERCSSLLQLETVPHPNLSSKEFVEQEYNMKDGVIRYKVRAATAGYVLRL